MTTLKKIPAAEFEIMKVIWKNTPPITTSMLMEQLGKEKKWRAQTLISLLSRLVEREFLSTEKNGKERTYFPLVSKEEYLKYETSNFMERFHENSFLSLVNTLYEGKKLSNKELEKLSEWIKKRGE
ncbi:BlaI/MecI/CopY family transcriptional regulator [Maledivibacter halophilus]|uniref:Predicted transcriptional regulator n=1 Tax=Maledivibacter halophilus TaxID=36842 RepID=A0A1T5MJ33_9FIRM|nr:BlaI/MecI/CopY family transcriptional regulator [Maledivibacter halophilus]SKC88222.1 Predicted transcriptional regulator [Maledivibacter halophilus]